MLELSDLKSFIDLGGVFLLALIMCYQQYKFFNNIEDKLIKILTLLTIVTKTNTNFNGVEGILNKDGSKIADLILSSESNHKSVS